MNDRDTFAAAALTGLLEPDDVTSDTDWWKAQVCRKAYEWADAMLRERERTAPSTPQVAPMSDPASTPQEPRKLDKAVMGWISEVTAALEDMDCVSDTAKGEIDSARCECGDAIQAMFRSSVGVSATGAESGSTPDAQGFGRSNEYPCQPFDSAPTTDQERFNAAVMNWISEATSIYEPRSDGGRSIMSSACMECWAAYGKHSTNHDAAPAATAVSTDDRTDKAAPSQCRDRPGDTPVAESATPDGYAYTGWPHPQLKMASISDAEIDSLEFVVEEGRIASQMDYGVLRSLLVRLRPEWLDRPKPVKDGDSDRPKPIATRLRQTRVNMLGTDDEQHYWDCQEAANKIELLQSKLRLQDAVIRSGDSLLLMCSEKAAIQFMLRHAAHAADEPAFPDSADYFLHSEALYGLMERTAKRCAAKPRNGAVVGPDPDSRVWETPAHTPQPQPTPGEGSKPREGTSEPVAWAVVSDSTEQIDCEFIYPDEATAGDVALDGNGKVCPLYRHPQPALTDAEREAVEWFAEVNKPLARLTKSNRREQYIATLRGLLERHRTTSTR